MSYLSSHTVTMIQLRLLLDCYLDFIQNNMKNTISRWHASARRRIVALLFIPDVVGFRSGLNSALAAMTPPRALASRKLATRAGKLFPLNFHSDLVRRGYVGGLASSSQAKPGLSSILSRLGHNLHTKYQGVKYYAGCQAARYTYPRCTCARYVCTEPKDIMLTPSRWSALPDAPTSGNSSLIINANTKQSSS